MQSNFVYSVDRSHSVLAWKVVGILTHGEVVDIVHTIKEIVLTLPQKQVKLLVDNRKMVDDGGKDLVFDSLVNDEWIKLQQWLIEYCSHVAVLCGTILMQVQMNRLAKTSGLSKVLKAYYNPLDPRNVIKDAYAFLEISGNDLVH